MYFDRALADFDFSQDHSPGRYVIFTVQVPSEWTQSDDVFEDENGTTVMKLSYLTEVGADFVLDESVWGDAEHILFFSAFAEDQQILLDIVDSMRFFF